MCTHSSRLYQDIMTSFISLYIVLSTVCVNLLSAVPEFSVSGPVGSTAVLPCNMTSVDTKSLYINWQIKVKTDYKTVFERLGVDSYQGEGYEGRVDVPVEELRKGNCSLVLRDLRLTDTDLYNSYRAVRRTKRGLSLTKEEISRGKLTVRDRPEETPDKHSDSPDKTEQTLDKHSGSSDKTEETPDINSDSSDNGGNNLHYWWILVLPAVVLLGLSVGVWHLKKRNTNNVI